MTLDPGLRQRLAGLAARHPYPRLFVTVSGAHLYGFPSEDSDFDLRGVHMLPAAEVVGLETGPETHQEMAVVEGLELDLVTHDVAKFFRLLLRRNGYVLEQLHSPLVVEAAPEHAELVALARECVTRHHNHHYRGFAHTQWRLFQKDTPHRVKPLLYVLRVLLTGIHLMRSGEVQADLTVLNQDFRLPYVDDLVDRKRAGGERGLLGEADLARFEAEYSRLQAALEEAHAASSLPERPSGARGLHDLLVRLRLGT